jgi:hypothetical protein
MNGGGETMKAYIGRLVLGSSIYNIWRTGNALRHGNNPWTEEKIKWQVKIRLLPKVNLGRLVGMLFFVMLGV